MHSAKKKESSVEESPNPNQLEAEGSQEEKQHSDEFV